MKKYLLTLSLLFICNSTFAVMALPKYGINEETKECARFDLGGECSGCEIPLEWTPIADNQCPSGYTEVVGYPTCADVAPENCPKGGGDHYDLFNDVDDMHPNFDAIKFLKNSGIIKGYEDGTFKPENNINRAEFTKIIIEATFNNANINGFNCFSDVHDEWFAKYVCTAKSQGIINGYPDGTFKPEQDISFVEAAKIISNSFGFGSTTDEIWYKPFVNNLEEKHAIPTSIDKFEKNITRSEMAEMIWRLKENVTNRPYNTYSILENKKPKTIMACPEDAQICPDGSLVGRMAPNCDFAACPTIK